MRTIKFRAWDTELNKWVCFHLEEAIINKDRHFALFLKNYCQFTGLKDKNGKEIYEGDVVRYKVGMPPEKVGEIIWGGWQYEIKRIVPHKDSTDFFGFNSEDVDINELEVISNIYENKELLK